MYRHLDGNTGGSPNEPPVHRASMWEESVKHFRRSSSGASPSDFGLSSPCPGENPFHPVQMPYCSGEPSYRPGSLPTPPGVGPLVPGAYPTGCVPVSDTGSGHYEPGASSPNPGRFPGTVVMPSCSGTAPSQPGEPLSDPGMFLGTVATPSCSGTEPFSDPGMFPGTVAGETWYPGRLLKLKPSWGTAAFTVDGQRRVGQFFLNTTRVNGVLIAGHFRSMKTPLSLGMEAGVKIVAGMERYLPREIDFEVELDVKSSNANWLDESERWRGPVYPAVVVEMTRKTAKVSFTLNGVDERAIVSTPEMHAEWTPVVNMQRLIAVGSSVQAFDLRPYMGTKLPDCRYWARVNVTHESGVVLHSRPGTATTPSCSVNSTNPGGAPPDPESETWHPGRISTVKQDSGQVELNVDGCRLVGRFVRDTTRVNGELLPRTARGMNAMFPVGAAAGVKVGRANGGEFGRDVTHTVEVDFEWPITYAPTPPSRSPVETSPALCVTFPAVVVNVHKKSAVATFMLNGCEERAQFVKAALCVDWEPVTVGSDMRHRLEVGTKVVIFNVEPNGVKIGVRYKARANIQRGNVMLLPPGPVPPARKQNRRCTVPPSHITSAPFATSRSPTPHFHTRDKVMTTAPERDDPTTGLHETGVVLEVKTRSGVASVSIMGREEVVWFRYATGNVDEKLPDLRLILRVGSAVTLTGIVFNDEHDVMRRYRGFVDRRAMGVDNLVKTSAPIQGRSGSDDENRMDYIVEVKPVSMTVPSGTEVIVDGRSVQTTTTKVDGEGEGQSVSTISKVDGKGRSVSTMTKPEGENVYEAFTPKLLGKDDSVLATINSINRTTAEDGTATYRNNGVKQTAMFYLMQVVVDGTVCQPEDYSGLVDRGLHVRLSGFRCCNKYSNFLYRSTGVVDIVRCYDDCVPELDMNAWPARSVIIKKPRGIKVKTNDLPVGKRERDISEDSREDINESSVDRKPCGVKVETNDLPVDKRATDISEDSREDINGSSVDRKPRGIKVETNDLPVDKRATDISEDSREDINGSLVDRKPRGIKVETNDLPVGKRERDISEDSRDEINASQVNKKPRVIKNDFNTRLVIKKEPGVDMYDLNNTRRVKEEPRYDSDGDIDDDVGREWVTLSEV